MSATVPNVHDPDIRRMVLRNHEPHEAWTNGGELLSVRCETCGLEWPCPSIEAARTIERAKAQEACS